MTNSVRNVVAAELGKLRTLPAVPVTVAVTILAMLGLAAAFAANAAGTGLRAVNYGQLGLIVLGILTAASEYSSGQIRTSLASVPNRALLLVGKVLAYLAVAAPVSLLAVAGSAALGGVPVLTARSLGATTYLTLIGLLGLAAAVVLRSLAGTFALMATLVLVASPLLVSVTALARYLPDRAGMQLYQPGDLTAIHGGAVMTAWIMAALTLAIVTFVKRDA
ncbi:hypothetical protein ABZ863_21805 [Saccharomonospora sp. NPDC046836]|uniref:hypothetical protein n=1 Tax=Saccharomonospora sp. NPDC046836 TaxID=3156921 RepID=UPI0033DA7180